MQRQSKNTKASVSNRPAFSKPEKHGAKIKEWLTSIWKSLVSSIIAKVIISLFLMSGATAFICNLLSQPVRTITIQGKVWDYDHPDFPLQGMPVYAESEIEIAIFRTDLEGRYSGEVSVNENEKGLRMRCGTYPYEPYIKGLPLNQQDSIYETYFTLKHFGRDQLKRNPYGVFNN